MNAGSSSPKVVCTGRRRAGPRIRMGVDVDMPPKKPPTPPALPLHRPPQVAAKAASPVTLKSGLGDRLGELGSLGSRDCVDFVDHSVEVEAMANAQEPDLKAKGDAAFGAAPCRAPAPPAAVPAIPPEVSRKGCSDSRLVPVAE